MKTMFLSLEGAQALKTLETQVHIGKNMCPLLIRKNVQAILTRWGCVKNAHTMIV